MVLQDCPIEDIRSEATIYLEQVLPVILRFLADEYDDTSSTVFPFLQGILTSVSPHVCVLWDDIYTLFSINASAKYQVVRWTNQSDHS